MCVINISLDTTTPNGTTIASASGQHRLQGNTNWSTPFNIILNNPHTPNITVLGIYELRVNVTNNVGVTSEWALGSFEINTNCSGDPDPVIVLGDCDVNCGGGWAISIPVPNGESRTFTIQKIGLASYASASNVGGGFTGCDLQAEEHISHDTSNDIFEHGPFFVTRSFSFGLDAEKGNTQAVSQLVVRISDGNGQEISADLYSRDNDSSPVFC